MSSVERLSKGIHKALRQAQRPYSESPSISRGDYPHLLGRHVEDITAEVQRRSEAEAIDAERHRIAREIHDGVAQSLGGLGFKSALWSHLADAAPPRMHAALDELQVAK